MIYHVLPGDAQVEEFKKTGIEGKAVVCREAFIAGPILYEDLDEFWGQRARFTLAAYGEDEIVYQEKVADELLRLMDAEYGDEVNLWFEYELFCAVNMWFCLDLLKGSGAKVFRVFPQMSTFDDVWKGFSSHSPTDLADCFDGRVEFSAEDMETATRAWEAFGERDGKELLAVGEYRSSAFPFLKEVCEAAAEIETRPFEIVREIMGTGLTGLSEIYPEFQKRAGVYGFGDLQVEKLIENV